MLVNQLQRDMASANQLECWAALTALSKLVTVDMIPAVMTDVMRLLGHKVYSPSIFYLCISLCISFCMSTSVVLCD